MDFGVLPPEINSGRMYAGPGSGPMLAAAAAWDGLATELQSTAADYGSVISVLTGVWSGQSSGTMAAAAAPYVAWMSATRSWLPNWPERCCRCTTRRWDPPPPH